MIKQKVSNKTIIILTMPRNGSSLLAGILHRLGVPMGSDNELTLGKHLNKYGCHEDQAFQSITLNLLFEAGLLLDITRRLCIDEDHLRKIVDRYKPMIKKVITKRQSQPLWGFKDPSLIYSLPYYDELFPNPYYIHLKRDVDESAASLFKTFRPSFWIPEMKEKFPLLKPRNRFFILLRTAGLLFTQNKEYNDIEIFKKVILKGHQRIEAFLKNKNFITIRLADLIQNPIGQIQRLIEYLHITPQHERIQNAIKFIKPELLEKDKKQVEN